MGLLIEGDVLQVVVVVGRVPCIKLSVRAMLQSSAILTSLLEIPRRELLESSMVEHVLQVLQSQGELQHGNIARGSILSLLVWCSERGTRKGKRTCGGGGETHDVYLSEN